MRPFIHLYSPQATIESTTYEDCNKETLTKNELSHPKIVEVVSKKVVGALIQFPSYCTESQPLRFRLPCKGKGRFVTVIESEKDLQPLASVTIA